MEEVYIRPDGAMTASLDGILEHQEVLWRKAWKAQEESSPFLEAAVAIPPRVDPHVLRRISRKFKTRTIAVDGIHPRHSFLLCTPALSALTGIFTVMNMISNAPSNLQE
eukprot:2754914-Pyramimonas_sp.AAC.1